MNVAEPPRRPRHLIDPATLGRPRPNLAAEKANLERVQRWVLSLLAVTTMLHLSGGFVLAALAVNPDRTVSRFVLVALAGVVGVASVMAGSAIHRRPLLSPWLVFGSIPALIGVMLIT